MSNDRKKKEPAAGTSTTGIDILSIYDSMCASFLKDLNEAKARGDVSPQEYEKTKKLLEELPYKKGSVLAKGDDKKASD